MAIISIGEIKVSHKNTAYVALRNFIQSNANLTNLHFSYATHFAENK